MSHSLRFFSDTSPVTLCFDSKKSPLIKISEQGVSFYKTKNEKMEAIETRLPTDKLIIVWAGEWSSDVFELTEDDILQIQSNSK